MSKDDEIKHLESFFEKSILSKYDLRLDTINWIDHGAIGNDVFAHYFKTDNRQYILVFEDFPSEQHFVADEGLPIAAKSGETFIHRSAETGEPYKENYTGYFSLYEEKPLL